MSAMAPQITSLAIVYSTVFSGADQRKQKENQRNAPRHWHKWPVIWWRHHDLWYGHRVTHWQLLDNLRYILANFCRSKYTHFLSKMLLKMLSAICRQCLYTKMLNVFEVCWWILQLLHSDSIDYNPIVECNTFAETSCRVVLLYSLPINVDIYSYSFHDAPKPSNRIYRGWPRPWLMLQIW